MKPSAHPFSCLYIYIYIDFTEEKQMMRLVISIGISSQLLDNFLVGAFSVDSEHYLATCMGSIEDCNGWSIGGKRAAR